MKKYISIILILLLSVLIYGCNNHIEIPNGVTPVKEFTVSKYLDNNAIFKANSNFSLSGTSEKDVVIICTIKSSKDNIVNQSYAYTDEFGNWELTMEAPKSSNKEYVIEVKDSTNKYVKTYSNIRFGESWLIIGDDIKGEILNEPENLFTEKFINNDNFMVYQSEKWHQLTDCGNDFAKYLILQLANEQTGLNSHPVSVVIATSEEATNAYQWIERDSIDSHLPLKNFLQNQSLYKDKNQVLTKNDMSYYAETYLKNINDLEFNNIIWNQGIKDFLDYNENSLYSFDTIYRDLLFNVMLQFEQYFESSERFYVLQESSNFISQSNILRNVQNNICNYYSQCQIIPTYDLCIVKDVISNKVVEHSDIDNNHLENYLVAGIEYDKLVDRILQNSFDDRIIPVLQNIVKSLDEDKNIINLRLIFNSSVEFTPIKDNRISGLSILDEDSNIIDAAIEIIDNEIIIDLSVEKEIIDGYNDLGEPIYKTIVEYLKPKYILYAQEEFIYNNNLFVEGIPVVPFSIVLK